MPIYDAGGSCRDERRGQRIAMHMANPLKAICRQNIRLGRCNRDAESGCYTQKSMVSKFLQLVAIYLFDTKTIRKRG
jgi:hypothetical protein